MEALDAVAPIVAVVAPAVLVLRDVATSGGPVVTRPERDPAAGAAPAGAADGFAPAGDGPIDGSAGGSGGGPDTGDAGDAGDYEPVEVTLGVSMTVTSDPGPHSMLAGLATEVDERSALRRVGAFVLLLGITLVTAALVAAGIYNGVAVFR